jgi:hypothetical protein
MVILFYFILFFVYNSSKIRNNIFCSLQDKIFTPIRNLVDEANTGWTNSNAAILSQHPNLASSLS